MSQMDVGSKRGTLKVMHGENVILLSIAVLQDDRLGDNRESWWQSINVAW